MRMSNKSVAKRLHRFISSGIELKVMGFSSPAELQINERGKFVGAKSEAKAHRSRNQIEVGRYG